MLMMMWLLKMLSEYLGSPDEVLLFPLLTPAHRSDSLQISKVVEFISELDQFGLIVNSYRQILTRSE